MAAPRTALGITKLEANFKENHTALMANTSKLTKEERKKTKRASRKKRKAENPLKPREYARGSAKRKVKKLARGTAKR
jgi:hypothetical protein